MSSCLQTWSEPIIPVQSLSNSGIKTIPDRYIKRTNDTIRYPESNVNIPIIDLSKLDDQVLDQVSNACHEWGFFQVVNHGVNVELMKNMRHIWREFFHLPIEEKMLYANNPVTYEGYGSRIGVEKGIKLDWSDYFFLNYLPLSARDTTKWPHRPSSIRELVMKYGEELIKLCEKLMKIFSKNLGLEEDHLQKAFGGGEEIGASLRANFYPKCPQPDLAFGLSPHSDPGIITILLPDDDVAGLQVRRGDSWITVEPITNAFIVNIGDQLQVVSNAIYKSVEHRVIVNSIKERVSLAFFYNPKGNFPIEPAKELVREDRPALYPPMTYNEYRLFIRIRGPSGKSQMESIKLPL